MAGDLYEDRFISFKSFIILYNCWQWLQMHVCSMQLDLEGYKYNA